MQINVPLFFCCQVTASETFEGHDIQLPKFLQTVQSSIKRNGSKKNNSHPTNDSRGTAD